jgi:protein-tyrosine kinase
VSKIHQSILKVKLLRDEAGQPQREGRRGRVYEENRPADPDKQLALYRLQAKRKYLPSRKHLEENRIIHDEFPEWALTRYKMLRTTVIQQMQIHDWKTLAVVAPEDGAGKTVTAINLAISLAGQGGNDVYLVDLDLRNPSIADYLGLPDDGPGIAEYLSEEIELADILWDIGVDNLTVLGNRDRMSDSSDQLVSRRMQEMYSDFGHASQKPLVVYDLPPVLTTDDAIAISPYVDCMLMVAAERETKREDLRHAVEMLSGTDIIGITLNKSGKR